MFRTNLANTVITNINELAIPSNLLQQFGSPIFSDPIPTQFEST